MSKRILELSIGGFEIPSRDDEVMRITRIADYSDVPNGEEERVNDYVKHYLKIQICFKTENPGLYYENCTPTGKEMIFPLSRHVITRRQSDIVGLIIEDAEFISYEVRALVDYLEEALKVDPGNPGRLGSSWGKLTFIPDWVWVEERNNTWWSWWHEEPPKDVSGKWMKYEEWVNKTGKR